MTDPRSPASDIEIRPASATDVPAMARLIDALGYPTEAGELADRFASFREAGDQALVAAWPAGESEGALVGLVTLHATPVLHRAGAVGRITALVVDPAARGLGIGRRLVDAAERWAAERGCVLIEVTSNRKRIEAHAFYESLGYERTSYRFGKPLPGAS